MNRRKREKDRKRKRQIREALGTITKEHPLAETTLLANTEHDSELKDASKPIPWPSSDETKAKKVTSVPESKKATTSSFYGLKDPSKAFTDDSSLPHQSCLHSKVVLAPEKKTIAKPSTKFKASTTVLASRLQHTSKAQGSEEQDVSELMHSSLLHQKSWPSMDNHVHHYGIHQESFHGISPDDVMSGELDVQILDYSSQILKTQFNIRYGLHLPSYLYGLEKSRSDNCSRIPTNARAVQIHIIQGHYLVSSLRNRQLYVYDRLYNRSHVLQLIPQLLLLYESHLVDNLQYSCPQSQGCSVLCGLFAVANTINILMDEPLGGTPFDTLEMRTHLRDCLKNGAFTRFPRNTSNIQSLESFEVHLQKEFDRFQAMKKDKLSNRNFKRKKLASNIPSVLTNDNGDTKLLSKTIKNIDKKKTVDNAEGTDDVLDQRKLEKEGKSATSKNINNQDRTLIREKNTDRQRKRRQTLTEDVKETIRLKDKEQHQTKRQTLSEMDNQVLRLKNKEQHQTKRRTFSEANKQVLRLKNKEQHKTKRQTLSETNKQVIRLKDKEHHQKKRQTLSEMDKQVLRIKNKEQHQTKRRTLSEVDKQVLRLKDKEQHRTKRRTLSEVDKQVLCLKNKEQHQTKRRTLSEVDKQVLRLKDKEQHQTKRQTLSEVDKQVLCLKDKEQHQTKRRTLSEVHKQVLRLKDKEQHQTKRQTLSEVDKQVLCLKDKEQHQTKRRTLSEVHKQVLRLKDKEQHQTKRRTLSEVDKQVLCLKNKEQHQTKRRTLSEVDKQVLRLKDKEQHQTKRQTLSQVDKQVLRLKNKKQHQTKRQSLSQEKKQTLNLVDRAQHQKQRQNMSVEKRKEIQTKDKAQHHKQRRNLSEEKRKEIRLRDQSQHRKQRENLSDLGKSTIRKKTQDSKRENRYNKKQIFENQLSSDRKTAEESIIQKFMKSIREGATYTCSVCYRMQYRSCVKRLNSSLQRNIGDLCIDLYGHENHWICHTCANHITRNKTPQQALSNNLKAADSPDILEKLYNLEKQLVCKIIPFMKIFSLPKGSQHGLKGQVVLVPSNIKDTAHRLPRDIKDAQLVALNLKRRMSDKNAYCKEFIRPQVVNDALKYLITCNKHYSDISMNSSWTDDSEKHDHALWKSVTGEDQYEQDSENDLELSNDNQEGNEDVITDSEDEIERSHPSEVAEDINMERSLNSSTCLYPDQGPIVRNNRVLNLAPAEGQTPTSVFYRPFWEALAFPTLFPDGKNTFHEEGHVKISPKKYVNARLLSRDFRFAESVEYTFQCLHWVESITVNDNITFALRKSRQSDVSVGSLQNPEYLQRMFKEDELFASFKRIRGTPQYWKDMQLDMLAKIRRFGPYTFFISGSAADLYWPELVQVVAAQYGELYDLEYIENEMDKKTKRNWLARNPVTVASHIDHIFRKLWGDVILSGLHPIGQILNYDIRKEMQSRGTAHFHSAVHVKDAPKLDVNSDEEVTTFIDKYITCIIPDDEVNPKLKDLVTSRQMHHHTRTCKKKKGIDCRFHYPKPPSSSTVIARVPCDDTAKQKIEHARDIIHRVMETLETIGTDHSLTDILTEAKLTSDEYESAISISMKKSNIILRRSPQETCINPYNAVILRCLRANMDIQYITDVWACVAYITSYMCKPERTMSELMRNACKEAETTKDKLKSIGSVFLKSREVSQHEAIASLIGLPLKQTNTPVLFVPTGYRSQRTRILKPRYILEKMNKDDTNIFAPNLLDKYAARPKDLDQMCLAEFSSSYSPCRKSSKDDEVEMINEVAELTNEKIILKDNLGILHKRNWPYVLRDYHVSKERDTEKYFHRLLLLYLHWRHEDELENEQSFEKKFLSFKDTVEENIKKFEPYIEEVQSATENVEQQDESNEEMWDRIAPQAEQHRDIDGDIEDPNPCLNTDILSEDQLNCSHDQRKPTQHVKRTNVIGSVNFESSTRHMEMVRSLNYRQREIHDHIFSWCRNLILATTVSEQPSPFHIFLSGGAGVGKSHTVHTIYQSAIRCLRKAGQNIDLPTVVLAAPTGKAAVNIGGSTLHSAFHLPVKQRGQKYDYKRPSATLLNAMRATYNQMKILIIDEISMVGATTLSNLDVTLQDIFEDERPFGNIAVLAVGDLMQLNPVGEKAVYKENNVGYSALSESVWHLFELFELNEIVRQKEDPAFAQLLSRLRVGKHSDTDVTSLKSLEQNPDVPDNSLSIFLTNELKDSCYKIQLDILQSRVYTIKARDSKRDLHTRQVVVNVTNTNPHETGGLANEIQVALQAKYMQTKNVDIGDGLVNGATGTIEKFDLPENDYLAGTIYVKFDDPHIGKEAKRKSKYKGLVPIHPVSTIFPFTDKSSSIQVERIQFPGTLAWGITVHKSQGSTFEQMIGDMTTPSGRTNTMPGQIYTMLSRAKSMKGLKLCSFEKDKIKVNASALQEMERLQKKPLQTDTFHKALCCSSESHTIAYLNVRSLKKHYPDLAADMICDFSGFLCFSETNVVRYNAFPIIGTQVISQNNKHHGTVIYSSCEDVKEISLVCDVFEVTSAIWKDILIVALYIRPAISISDIREDMRHMLDQVKLISSEQKTGKVVILGDFNISFQQLNALQPLMDSYGLNQVMSSPTHESGSILDLLYTNITDYSVNNIPVWFSDHHAIVLHFSG